VGQRKPAIAALAASVALLLLTVAIGSAVFAWNLSEKEKHGKIVRDLEASVGVIKARLGGALDKLWENPGTPSVIITSAERAALMGNKPGRPAVYPGEPLLLTFGVYTFENPSMMAKKFNPFLAALEESMAQRLGRPVLIDLIIYRSYTNGHEGLLSGEVDFMRVGPASYVLMKEKRPGISLLVAGKKRIECEIITRAGSGITNLSQLKGKAFAFGDPESTFGTYRSEAGPLGRWYPCGRFSRTRTTSRRMTKWSRPS
jgi:ABC-type phosphate/phosphonate transport system substrate-binding protein